MDSQDLITLKKKAWQILEEARRQGNLTEAESKHRMNLVYSAHTLEDLDAVLEDLVSVKDDVPVAPANEDFKSLTIFSERQFHEQELTSNPSLTAVMGSIRLQFSKSPGPRLQNLHLTVIMGEAKIRVPSGTKVITAITPVMGDLRMDTRRGSPGTGPLTLVVSGYILMGELKIQFD